MKQRRYRLTTVGPVIISAILLLVFTVIYIISLQAGSATIQEGLDDVSLPVLNTTSRLLFNPLYTLDITTMTSVLEPYVDGTSVVYSAVNDTKGTRIVEIKKKWTPDSALIQGLSVEALARQSIVSNQQGHYLILAKPISAGTTQIGTVAIVFDKAPFQSSLGRAQVTISLTLVIALIVTALLFYALFRIGIRPLNRLALVSREISRGNASAKIPVEGSEEIRFLATTLDEYVEAGRNA